VEVIKFMNYVRSITSTVAGTAVDAATTREIVKGGRVLGN
jgi:hypothetical protein